MALNKLILFILPTFILSALLSQGDNGGFKPMFNGRDLTGWNTNGNWVVESGNVITLKPRAGEYGWKRYADYLRTEKKYGDFILDLEFKFNKKGNSGVFMRVGDTKNHVESGMEVQILDTHGKKNPGPHDCGGLIRTSAPSRNMVKPAGEWNRYVITLVKDRLKVVLNGELIQDVDLSQSAMKDRPKLGYISFQDEAKRVWYRNVKIKDLNGGVKQKEVREAVEKSVHAHGTLAKKFSVPAGFEVRSFAGKSLISNPLSLAIDKNNEVYLGEVWRFHRGVEDTRQHNYWMEDEVRIMNMDDKLALFTKWTDKGKFKPGHFTEYSDRVLKLHDTDKDGVCDKVTEFAGGFNKSQDGIGSSIIFDEDNFLYYANIPHVWKLKDKDGDGKAEYRQKIVSGFGLRMGVSGHDLHGLEWGADGRLYFSNGDRGYDVVSKEGKRFYSESEGAVFRCEPDGSNLERFTRGNRNPQDLEFDELGNLYTVDNNRGFGDRSRICYLVEGGQYGWNSGYENITQFRKALKLNKRKGPNYIDPWIGEGTWKPSFKGQPLFCIPALGHIDGGAAGLLFNTSESLGEKYRNSFIFAACSRGVHSFKTEPEGAGMKVNQLHKIWDGGYLVDAELSHDGTLYVLDYITASNKPGGKGHVYTMSNGEAKMKTSVLETVKILPADAVKFSIDYLMVLLGHEDRRVRLKAQFEIVKRNDVGSLSRVAHDAKRALVSRLHAIWGLGQLSRTKVKVNEVYWDLLKDANSEIVSQVIKVLGETKDSMAYAKLLPLVEHPSERVISFLAPALAKCGGMKAHSVLCDLARKNTKQDPFLRNAIVTGLHYAGDVMSLLSNAKDTSEALRLHSLLALLRLEDPKCRVYLNDSSDRIKHSTIRGIYRHNIEAAVTALAQHADYYEKGHATTPQPVIARSIQSNFRLGDLASANRLKAMALNVELPLDTRLICLYELTRWNELQIVDPVAGLVRSVAKKRADAKPLVIEILKAMGQETNKDIDFHVVTLSSAYGLNVNNSNLAALAMNLDHSVSDRVKYYEAINDEDIRKKVRDKFLDEKDRFFVEKAILEMYQQSAKKAVDYLLKRVEKGENLQGVYRGLATLKDKRSLQVLLLGAKKLLSKKHESESVLDLILALEQRAEPEAEEALRRYTESFAKEDTLKVYRHTLVGGNARIGKEIVKSGKGNCMVCHKFNRSRMKMVGPPLVRVANHKRARGEYLLLSLIAPSDYVVKGYGDEKISAMPNMKTLLKKSEIRDVVAYLRTLKDGNK